MVCRQCGTEIADKAIVCFRCGTGTSDPVRKPVAVGPKRSPVFAMIGVVLLVLLGLFLGQAGQTVLPPGQGYGLPVGVAIGIAIIVLVVRIIRRR